MIYDYIQYIYIHISHHIPKFMAILLRLLSGTTRSTGMKWRGREYEYVDHVIRCLTQLSKLVRNHPVLKTVKWIHHIEFYPGQCWERSRERDEPTSRSYSNNHPAINRCIMVIHLSALWYQLLWVIGRGRFRSSDAPYPPRYESKSGTLTPTLSKMGWFFISSIQELDSTPWPKRKNEKIRI